MSFQKCPACGGTGIDQANRLSTSATPTCPVCNGKRIISSLTGQPPNNNETIYPPRNKSWGGK